MRGRPLGELRCEARGKGGPEGAVRVFATRGNGAVLSVETVAWPSGRVSLVVRGGTERLSLTFGEAALLGRILIETADREG